MSRKLIFILIYSFALFVTTNSFALTKVIKKNIAWNKTHIEKLSENHLIGQLSFKGAIYDENEFPLIFEKISIDNQNSNFKVSLINVVYSAVDESDLDKVLFLEKINNEIKIT